MSAAANIVLHVQAQSYQRCWTAKSSRPCYQILRLPDLHPETNLFSLFCAYCNSFPALKKSTGKNWITIESYDFDISGGILSFYTDLGKDLFPKRFRRKRPAIQVDLQQNKISGPMLQNRENQMCLPYYIRPTRGRAPDLAIEALSEGFSRR